MTIEALVRVMARRCGLQDPDAFALRAATTEEDEVIDPVEPWRKVKVQRVISVRGTGRTTRMLLQAMVALEIGAKVEIVTADHYQANNHAGRLNALMDQAGIKVQRGQVFVTFPTRRAVHERPDIVLVGHFVQESSA